MFNVSGLWAAKLLNSKLVWTTMLDHGSNDNKSYLLYYLSKLYVASLDTLFVILDLIQVTSVSIVTP